MIEMLESFWEAYRMRRTGVAGKQVAPPIKNPRRAETEGHDDLAREDVSGLEALRNVKARAGARRGSQP
jgi:hypothetical protein